RGSSGPPPPRYARGDNFALSSQLSALSSQLSALSLQLPFRFPRPYKLREFRRLLSQVHIARGIAGEALHPFEADCRLAIGRVHLQGAVELVAGRGVVAAALQGDAQ